MIAHPAKRKWQVIILIIGIAMLLMSACGSSETSGSAQQNDQAGQGANRSNEGASTDSTETADTWEELIKLAYEEGEITVTGWPSADREELMREFENEYPGIRVNYVGMRYVDAMTKIREEQSQGKYLWDVQLEGLIAEFEDITDYIFDDPEVTSDENWYWGFDYGYKALEDTPYKGRFIYGVQPVPQIFINNDVIPEGEITSFEDLLDPKYKGKIVSYDFSVNGQGAITLTSLARAFGKEFVTELIETTEPVVSRDHRLIAQWFATGPQPITIGLDSTQFNAFVDSGLVKKVQMLRFDKTDLYSPFALAVLKNPPHPNATKVFINWFLSKKGQEKFVELIGNYHSRRSDVPEANNPYVIPYSMFDLDNPVNYFENQVAEVEKWVLEQGAKYVGSQK